MLQQNLNIKGKSICMLSEYLYKNSNTGLHSKMEISKLHFIIHTSLK